MFCPSCGVKIEDKSQKFCTSCGSEFPSDIPTEAPAKTPQPGISETKPAPTYQRQTVPTYRPASIQTGGPGPESKKCLIFALVSIGLFIIGVSVGGSSFFRNIIGYSYFPTIGLGVAGGIISIVLHIVGLIFAILGRVSSGRADSEPVNNVERFGSVIAVFGIIINVIPIFVIPVFLVINFGSSFLFNYL